MVLHLSDAIVILNRKLHTYIMSCYQGYRMIILISWTLFFTVYSSLGQDPIYIRHDFLAQKTVYYKLTGTDTVWLSHIKVKKQQSFIIDINNINTFYYTGSLNLEKRTQETFTAKTIFAPFSMLTKTFGGSFSTLLPLIEKIRGTRGRSESVLQEEATFLLQSFEEVYQRIWQDDAYYKKLLVDESFFNTLKKDITKTEQEIKKEAQDYLKANLPSIFAAWQQKKLPDAKYDLQLKMRIDSVKLLFEQLSNLKKEVKEDFTIDGETFYAKFQKTGYYYAQVINLATNDYQQGDEFIKKLNSIYRNYNDIATANFSYRFKTDASHLTAGMKLAIFPKSPADGQDTVYRYFEVNKPTYGLKLRNSIGIAFSYIKEGNRNYFVKLDSTVGYSKGDQFTPLITSFLHFHFASKGIIKPGFLLGIGIPLSNERNINFLGGGSLIFGKNEMIYLSAGLTGAKINKLDKGLKPGDKVPAGDYELPFKSFYNIGYFLSLSFNLNLINGNKQ